MTVGSTARLGKARDELASLGLSRRHESMLAAAESLESGEAGLMERSI